MVPRATENVVADCMRPAGRHFPTPGVGDVTIEIRLGVCRKCSHKSRNKSLAYGFDQRLALGKLTERNNATGRSSRGKSTHAIHTFQHLLEKYGFN